MARGSGAIVEDVDGNVFLDCTAGIAVAATGHSHPDVVRAVTEQAQRFLHMSGTDFYYEPQVKLAEELAADRPDRRRRAIVFRQLRRRSDRGVHEAVALRHQAHQHHRVSRRVSRPNARRALADGEQGDSAPRVRSDGARRLPRARIRTAIAVRSV